MNANLSALPVVERVPLVMQGIDPPFHVTDERGVRWLRCYLKHRHAVALRQLVAAQSRAARRLQPRRAA